MSKQEKTNKLKLLTVCIFLMFAFILFNRNVVYGSNKTKAEIGGYIAEFAINFYNEHNSETVYDWTYAHRAEAYHGRKMSGTTCDHDSRTKNFSR